MRAAEQPRELRHVVSRVQCWQENNEERISGPLRVHSAEKEEQCGSFVRAPLLDSAVRKTQRCFNCDKG